MLQFSYILNKIGTLDLIVILSALGLAIFIVFIIFLVALKRGRKVISTSGQKLEKRTDHNSEKSNEDTNLVSGYMEYLKQALPSVKDEIKQIENILNNLKGGANSDSSLHNEVTRLKKELDIAKSSQNTVGDSSGKEEEISQLISEKEILIDASKDLETKLNNALSELENLKKLLENKDKELEEVKSDKENLGVGSSDAGINNEAEELKEKISFLESQLAEYEIIEEDIANLKTLQEEKKELLKKIEALGGGNGSDIDSSVDKETELTDENGQQQEFSEEFSVEDPSDATESSKGESGISNEFEKFLNTDSNS